MLSFLNEELFVEVRQSEEDVINHFGLQVGRLMVRHAQLEDEFNNTCLENGVKILPIDDEDTSEE